MAAIAENGGQPVLCCHPKEHLETVFGEDGHDEQTTVRLGCECINRAHHFQGIAYRGFERLHAEQGRGRFDGAELTEIDRLRVEHERHSRDVRSDLLEQLQPLATERIDRTGESGRITFGSHNVLHQASVAGSFPAVKTIGMVFVCSCTAAVAGRLEVTITSGARLTNSAA